MSSQAQVRTDIDEVDEGASYSEIGKLLRTARQQMKLPIEQAARMLHIRVRYLDALEQGRLEELPGLTYTKGYLQAYASFLGLDKEEILRRFEQVESLLARKNFYLPQVFSKEKTPSPNLVWGGVVAAVVVYLVWALFIQSNPQKISLVERFPEAAPAKVRLTAATAGNVTCLNPDSPVYPPCTMARTQPLVFDLLPLRQPLNSVMDLAALKFTN